MRIRIPETTLSTDLDGDGVLLNLDTGEYFGLDEVAMDMWRSLRSCGTVEAAGACLLARYDVDAPVLERDLRAFVATLVERRLVVCDE